METLKKRIMENFEVCVVLAVLAGVLCMHFFVVYKAPFLHFYYLPVLVAGFVLGRRAALSASVLAVGFVLFFALTRPADFSIGGTPFERTITVVLWGGFLILTSYVVGNLYQRKEEKIREVQDAYVGVLQILSKYIEGNDKYTQGHSLRVSYMAARLGAAMGLSEKSIENCRVAGLLHDIGKVEISLNLIRKAAALTEAERRIIDTHASRGARIIDSFGPILHEVVPIIEEHHTPYSKNDRINDQVPLESFIIAVADAYDAMITDRPYRAGRQPFEAIAELENSSGTQFCPAAVAAFKRLHQEQGPELEAFAHQTQIL